MAKNNQTEADMQKQIDQLLKLVSLLSKKVGNLEKENVRIKHEMRGVKLNINSLDSRLKQRGG